MKKLYRKKPLNQPNKVLQGEHLKKSVKKYILLHNQKRFKI